MLAHGFIKRYLLYNKVRPYKAFSVHTIVAAVFPSRLRFCLNIRMPPSCQCDWTFVAYSPDYFCNVSILIGP